MKTGPKIASLTNEWAPLEAGSTVELAGSRFTVLDLRGPELIRSRLPFTFEDADGERATQFRERYNPGEAVAGGATEVEQLKLLRDWVARKVPFGKPEHHNVDPFYIMDRAAEGALHNCTYNSMVYLAALESLGHTARKLSTCGHGTVEIWSNELCKWIVLDPSRRNCYLLDGEILDARQVHEQYLSDGGVSMQVEYGLDERIEQVTMEPREDGLLKYRQDGYEWVGYHDRNNFMDSPVDFDKDRFYIYRDELNRDKVWVTRPKDPAVPAELDERFKTATLTDRLGDIYWTVNVTKVHLAPLTSKRLAVQLETMTPNFDTFLVEKDGDWKPTRPEFAWNLKRDVNTLTVRSRNSRGIVGPVASVMVEMRRTAR